MTGNSCGWLTIVGSVLNQWISFQEQPFHVPKAGNMEVGTCEKTDHEWLAETGQWVMVGGWMWVESL